MMTKREEEDKRDGRNGNCLRNSCRGGRDSGTDEEKAFFPHSRRLRRVQLLYATHHICSVFGIFLPPSLPLSLSGLSEVGDGRNAVQGASYPSDRTIEKPTSP